jgi:hypothetical protein
MRYLMKCHNPAKRTYVVQIGEPGDYVFDLQAGTGFWGLPPYMPPNRYASYFLARWSCATAVFQHQMGRVVCISMTKQHNGSLIGHILCRSHAPKAIDKRCRAQSQWLRPYHHGQQQPHSHLQLNYDIRNQLPPTSLCWPCRTVYTITQSSTGGSDALAAAAAALAAASVAVNQTRPALAAQALNHAKQLYSWASSPSLYNTTYCGAVVPCRGIAVPLQGGWSAAQAAGGGGGGTVEVPWVGYPSSSALDDLSWAGAWLHRATGEHTCARYRRLKQLC